MQKKAALVRWSGAVRTHEQFHAYIVELLTMGDAAIPKLVALEVADQILETVESNPELVRAFMRDQLRQQRRFAGRGAG